MISVGAISLGDLVAATARAHPARAALWVDGEFVAYKDLVAMAARLGGAIRAASPVAGDRRVRQCALLVDRSLTGYTAVLGTIFAGFTYVPLNPRFPPDRLVRILDACDAHVLVIDAASLDAARAVLKRCARPLSIVLPDLPSPPDWIGLMRPRHVLCRHDIERLPPASGTARISGDDGAYLLFTSGSTGLPKGVLIRHDNALAYVRTAFGRYRPTPQDRFTQLFDFSFDLSAHDMFLCWSAGACLYCPPVNAVAGLRDFVREHELTFWFSVPSTAAYLSRMKMLAPNVFPSLRMSLFCGEALPARLASVWRKAAPGSVIENLYGPTEATIAITAYRLPDRDGPVLEERPIIPIGMPFPGQHVAVIDADGRLVPDGEPGELCLAGSQVARGYWNLPEVTATRFAAPVGLPDGAPRHWYRTGDRVAMSHDCGLLFLGRMDHQVKIRGYRVDLHEVESVVRDATGSESIAALPWPADDLTLARGVVVFVAGNPRATDEIVARCASKLPPAIVPRQFFFIPDWPLNCNGKTDYAALKRRLQEGQC